MILDPPQPALFISISICQEKQKPPERPRLETPRAEAKAEPKAAPKPELVSLAMLLKAGGRSQATGQVALPQPHHIEESP